MKSRLAISAALAVSILAVAPASADLFAPHRSSDNPVVEIARSTLYGGLAGMSVGLAIASLDRDRPNPDLITSGYAIGTFAGLGLGIYWAFSRHPSAAMFDLSEAGPRVGFAPPEITPDGGARMRLVSVGF